MLDLELRRLRPDRDQRLVEPLPRRAGAPDVPELHRARGSGRHARRFLLPGAPTRRRQRPRQHARAAQSAPRQRPCPRQVHGPSFASAGEVLVVPILTERRPVPARVPRRRVIGSTFIVVGRPVVYNRAPQRHTRPLPPPPAAAMLPDRERPLAVNEARPSGEGHVGSSSTTGHRAPFALRIAGILRRGGRWPVLLLNAVVPFVVYQALSRAGVDPIPALAGGGRLPPDRDGLGVGAHRTAGRYRPAGAPLLRPGDRRRGVTDNPLVVLYQGSVVNVVSGLLCFGSLLWPLVRMFYLSPSSPPGTTGKPSRGSTRCGRGRAAFRTSQRYR